MPWGVAAAAVAGVAGSALQSGATSSAADKATAAQQQAQERARADLQPWAATGGLANTASTDLLGLNGPDAATAAFGNYQTSPGYQWQLGEGLRAVDAGAAAKGILRSGATLKAEQAYGAGLADQDFGQYYNRLFGLSQLGEKAAAGTGEGDIKTGQGIAATDLALGQQQSSIYGNLASGIGGAANSYATNSLYADRTAAMAQPGGYPAGYQPAPINMGYTVTG